MTTGCSVVYVDSGCGFSSTRLMQMLSSRGLKDEVRYADGAEFQTPPKTMFLLVSIECSGAAQEGQSSPHHKHL